MHKKLFLLISVATLGSQLHAEEPVSVEPVSLWEKVREELASTRQSSEDTETCGCCSHVEDLMQENGHTLSTNNYAELSTEDQKTVVKDLAEKAILACKIGRLPLQMQMDQVVLNTAIILSGYNKDQQLQEIYKKLLEKKEAQE